MLVATLAVLGVTYWRERFGRAGGAVCAALYVPVFLIG